MQVNKRLLIHTFALDHHRYKSKVQIISIRWLSERVIMTMDRQERVHVIDVKAMVLVDIVDVTRVQLTFNDRFSVQMCKEKKRDPSAPALKACVKKHTLAFFLSM
jgi:hypothetical protein